MSRGRSAIFFAGALALLGATASLLVLPSEVRRVPLRTPFDSVPKTLRGWSASDQAPPGVIPMDPGAPEHLFRTYVNGSHTVWVSVGYYPAQGEGHRSAQELLYPGQGWSNLSDRPVRVPLDGPQDPSIPATVLLIRTGDRRVAILYWYQVQARSIASDHWYRAVLLYNRLIHRRADAALVRIASPVLDAADPAGVVAKQMEFVQAFYPELLRSLPR